MKANRKLAVIAGVAALSPIAWADVLHDTLFIAETGLQTNAIVSNIGGYLVWGRKIDSQICEDFAVPAGGRIIDTVTADSIGYIGAPPADGVLVEIFADLGGYPAETPTYSYLATGSDIDIQYFGYPWGGPRYRITVTLPADACSLAEGNWYISQIPIDTTNFSDGYFVFRGNITYYGTDTYVRNGGQDHLADGWWFGGYDGVWPSDDWTLHADGAGESAFQVTGHEIAAGCPADYNGDGFVDPLDYNGFINDFEAGNMAADFNGDTFLDPLDYNGFINAFEAGC